MNMTVSRDIALHVIQIQCLQDVCVWGVYEII